MRAPREDIRPTLGRSAITLAVLTVGFLPAAYALVALVLSIGPPSAADDARAMFLGEVAAYGGFALALLAFLLAGASRMRREPIDTLWLPFALLPILAALGLLIYLGWVR